MNHSNNALFEPPLRNGLFIFILKKSLHLELSKDFISTFSSTTILTLQIELN